MEDEIDMLRNRLRYDPETGNLHWTWVHHKATKIAVGDVAGGVNNYGYLMLTANRKTFSAHRVAWLLFHGAWPQHQIDHINGDRRDNRIANLRDVTAAANSLNRTRAAAKNRIGILGVRIKGDRFYAQITVRGKAMHLGSFTSTREAHSAYCAARASLGIPLQAGVAIGAWN